MMSRLATSRTMLLLVGLLGPVASSGACEVSEAAVDCGPDDDTTSGADGNGDAITDATTLSPEGELTLGWNLASESHPTAFREASAGDPVLLQYGRQGGWMLVLATRSCGLFRGRVDLEVDMQVVDEPSMDTVVVHGMPLELSDDGCEFVMGIALPLEAAPVVGKDVRVTIRVSDSCGSVGEVTGLLHVEQEP